MHAQASFVKATFSKNQPLLMSQALDFSRVGPLIFLIGFDARPL
jgi:hypothetical protein